MSRLLAYKELFVKELVSRIYHSLTVTFLLIFLWNSITINVSVSMVNEDNEGELAQNYGYILTFLLYIPRLHPLLSLPFCICNILGILSGPPPTSRTSSSLIPTPSLTTGPGIALKKPLQEIPFLCFRVVTRGLYPDLIKENVRRNIATCQQVGIPDFKIEVVTDRPLGLPKHLSYYEVVVPNNYVSTNHSLYKARALNYCLENGVDQLSKGDWIVHLDEETLLTHDSVIGLANFASQDLGDVGQGVITYANEEIVNWLTTLADCVRVAVDYGMMRFSFKYLHAPFSGLKGSYIIVKYEVEKEIGFDFGPKGSVAEDMVFALLAWSKGHKFNFVEGQMWEKSTFSVQDYIRQRSRWFKGHVTTYMDRRIPWYCKLGMIPADICWALFIFNVMAVPLMFYFPLPTSPILNILTGFVTGTIGFLFAYGAVQSFSVRRYGIFRKLILVLLSQLIIPIVGVLDGIASAHAMLTQKHGEFYIVNKDNKGPEVSVSNV